MRPFASSPDIYNLLAKGMGSDLQWFPEDVPVSRLAATLASMANTEGGVILLGIAPRSAQIQGVSNPPEAIDKVFQAALLTDPPLVLPVPALYPAGSGNIKVLWITVPAGLPNVYSLNGSYLGRDGRQTNPLSARRLRQLLIERGAIQFENRVPAEASLDDLDPALIGAYIDALHQRRGESSQGTSSSAAIDLLLQRGCLARVNGEIRPNYAGILLFGRYPQQWLPNATILAARFPGIAFSDRFIKKDISGALPEQLRQVEAFVHTNLRSVVRLAGLVHKEMPEYPFEAVRELLINAAAHRDYNLQGDNIHINIYADRLEVQSPGNLPGPVNLDNLLDARFSRNAVIFQVLSDLGFVERLGYGLDRVVTVMKQNSLRSPKFEEAAGCFKVTLFAAEEKLPGEQSDLSEYLELNLNPRQQMALSYLASHQRITSSFYQDLCPDVHSETLRRDLVDMVQRGILIKIGDKRATYYILKKKK